MPPTDTAATYPLAVDFYLPDATGQGKTYIASDTYTTAGSVQTADLGNAAALGISPGNSTIIATATDAQGNTSEFSSAALDFAPTYVVTNTLDSGPGSLRQALVNVDAGSGAVISFGIPTSDPGYNSATHVYTIKPASALPTLTGAATIDGTTQPGFAGQPVIELRGDAAGAGASSLVLAAGSNGSTIRGLVINRFTSNGISIQSSDNTIAGDWIGTDITGTSALANANGVVISMGGSNNTIGGSTAADRNLISGNTTDGVDLTGSGTSGNVVEGNYIGSDISGTVALPNQYGINIAGTGGSNTISGATSTPGTGAGNLIAGNFNSGIYALGKTATDLIQGNVIGSVTLAGGGTSPGNGYEPFTGTGAAGIYLKSDIGIQVGGLSTQDANVISGNTYSPVGSAPVGCGIGGVDSTATLIEGNLIGTNLGGSALRPTISESTSWGVPRTPSAAPPPVPAT